MSESDGQSGGRPDSQDDGLFAGLDDGLAEGDEQHRGQAGQPGGPGAEPRGQEEVQARPDGPKVLDIQGKSTLEILAQIDIFDGLPAPHLRRVVEIGVEEQYKASATIFSEGDAGDSFYLILEGAVRISRIVPGMGEEALAVLRPGAYFGEMSLIDEAPRSAAAICHERCRLFVLNRRDLEDLLFVDRDLAYELLWNFVRTLSRRLRATNDKMTFLATSNKF
jgi:CRP/FNR family transcriptional regulator, cyclic AMP receptor protein